MFQNRLSGGGTPKDVSDVRPLELLPDLAAVIIFGAFVAGARPATWGSAVGLFYIAYGLIAAAWVQLRLLPCFVRIASGHWQDKENAGTNAYLPPFPHSRMLPLLATTVISTLGPLGMPLHALSIGRYDSDPDLGFTALVGAHNCVFLSLAVALWFLLRCIKRRDWCKPSWAVVGAVLMPAVCLVACIVGVVVVALISRGRTRTDTPIVTLALGCSLALLAVMALQYRVAASEWNQNQA
jgi:hypothetical protein